MTSWDSSHPEEPPPKRDIYYAVLREEPSRGKARRLAAALVAGVRWLVNRIAGNPGNPGAGEPAAQVAADATSLLVDAATGKLEAASLEGQLKEAQIQSAFADARMKNAQAKKIEAETAWYEVEKTLSLCTSLNIPVDVAVLPDGKPCITMGTGLSRRPELPSGVQERKQIPPPQGDVRS